MCLLVTQDHHPIWLSHFNKLHGNVNEKESNTAHQQPVVLPEQSSIEPIESSNKVLIRPLPKSGKIEYKIGEHGYDAKLESNEDNPEILSPVDTTAIPFGYPNVIFQEDNVDDISALFELMALGVISCKIEKGKMKIKCLNENSSNSVRNILAKLAFRRAGSTGQVPIVILSNIEIESRIELSCILDEGMNWKKFLTSVGADGFDSSFWMPRDEERLPTNQYKMKFSVDGISLFQLIKNDLKITIGGKIIRIKIEVNPFAADMNNDV